eukprot:Gb_02478 [translate_table: standard]
MPLRRNKRREAGGPLEFEKEANQDSNNFNLLWQEYARLEEACKDALLFRDFCELRTERGNNRARATQYQKLKLEIPKFTSRIANLVQQMDGNQQKNRIRRDDVRPRVPQSQKSRLETSKFTRKDDGMDVLIKIHEPRQHFKYYEKEGELAASVPLPSDATKKTNLFVPRSNRVLPKAASSLVSTGQVSKSALAKHATNALDEVSRGAYEQPSIFQLSSLSPIFMNAIQMLAQTGLAPPNLDEQKLLVDESAIPFQQTWSPSIVVQIQYSAHSSQVQFSSTPTRPLPLLQSPIMHSHKELMHQGQQLKFAWPMLPPTHVINQYITQQSNRAVKITHPETHEELKLDSNRERFAWFSKTLWIDDHKSVYCYDGQSVSTVDTMAFDPRSVNYDSPFVLTVGTMVINTRVCYLRLPTLGAMVFRTNAMDSNIPYFEHSMSVVFLNIQTAGEIRVIFGIPKQCQVGFMLEDAGIFDDRGMVMSACGRVLKELPHERNFIPIDHLPTAEDIDLEFFPTLPPDWGKECIMELESACLDQLEAGNAAKSSKVKSQKLFFKLKRVVEKCPVGDMDCLNGVHVDEPLDIETKLVLGFLRHHMLGTPVASLRKIYLESGLGDAIVGVLLPLVPLFCRSPLGDRFVVNPTVKQVEESKFDLLLVGTANAIMLIEGYNDFLTEELLLQAVDIGQSAVKATCKEVEFFVNKSKRNKMDEAIRVTPPECYKQVEELATSGLIEALQIKSKMPQMKAISSLGTRLLTIFPASRIPSLQQKKNFQNNPFFTFNALRAMHS